ncbi:MAG TPA: HAMP domain-containing sensor histidine kinase [Alphaproteobacteria bacterium]|jgi:two-component system cell cycle sensor histidine kinase PleC
MSFSQVEVLAKGAEPERQISRKDLFARALRVERARKIDPRLRQLLRANVVRGLFLHAPGVLLLDALVSIAAAFVFWREGRGSIVAAWLALILAATVLRWLYVVRYFSAEPPAAEARRWAQIFTFSAFVSGVLWGIGSIAFYSPGNGVLLIVQVFLVTGLCAGALAGYAAHMPSFYAFLPPVVIPFGACLALDGVPAHLFTATLLAVWVSVIVFLAHLLNEHITDRLLLLDRAMLADAMERSRNAAEAANRAKSHLLANVSHELRTPLNAIIGFSDIMSAEMFGPHGVSRYRDYSRDINASGSHLLNVINDILDAAKLEAGRIRLNESTSSVTDLVEHAERMLRFGASKGSVKVSTFVPRDIPQVRVDLLRFRQVLINLLSNAVKFTPAGGHVSVMATIEADGDLLIHVKDDGIGMRSGDVAKAFLPFVQLDQPSPRGDTGTGLGLALAKSWVEAHGGKLTLASELGIGTTATIRLPRERLVWPMPAPSEGMRAAA